MRAGKVTVGLASHWPRVKDFSGLSTYGLTAGIDKNNNEIFLAGKEA